MSCCTFSYNNRNVFRKFINKYNVFFVLFVCCTENAGSTGEDEDDTCEGSAPRKNSSGIGGNADSYIEIPTKMEQPQPTSCFLEKPGIDKKVKVSDWKN